MTLLLTICSSTHFLFFGLMLGVPGDFMFQSARITLWTTSMTYKPLSSFALHSTLLLWDWSTCSQCQLPACFCVSAVWTVLVWVDAGGDWHARNVEQATCCVEYVKSTYCITTPQTWTDVKVNKLRHVFMSESQARAETRSVWPRSTCWLCQFSWPVLAPYLLSDGVHSKLH